MKNEAEKIDNQQGNGVLPCVSGLLPSDEEATKMVNEFIDKWAEMNPTLDKNFYWSGVNDGVYMLLNKLRGNNR
jgi:hypothetical protein